MIVKFFKTVCWLKWLNSGILHYYTINHLTILHSLLTGLVGWLAWLRLWLYHQNNSLFLSRSWCCETVSHQHIRMVDKYKNHDFICWETWLQIPVMLLERWLRRKKLCCFVFFQKNASRKEGNSGFTRSFAVTLWSLVRNFVCHLLANVLSNRFLSTWPGWFVCDIFLFLGNCFCSKAVYDSCDSVDGYEGLTFCIITSMGIIFIWFHNVDSRNSLKHNDSQPLFNIGSLSDLYTMERRFCGLGIIPFLLEIYVEQTRFYEPYNLLKS